MCPVALASGPRTINFHYQSRKEVVSGGASARFITGNNWRLIYQPFGGGPLLLRTGCQTRRDGVYHYAEILSSFADQGFRTGFSGLLK